MAKKTKVCGHCGRRMMHPCGSPREVQSCAYNKSRAYAIANTKGHPLRLVCSLLVMEYHESLDLQYLEQALSRLFSVDHPQPTT